MCHLTGSLASFLPVSLWTPSPLPGLSGPPLSLPLLPLSCFPAVHMGRPLLPTLGLASSAVPASSSRSRQAAWTPMTSGLCLSPQDTAWYAASASLAAVPLLPASPPPLPLPLLSLPLSLPPPLRATPLQSFQVLGDTPPPEQCSPLSLLLLHLLGWGPSDDSLSLPLLFLEFSERGGQSSGSPPFLSLSLFLSSPSSRADL